MNTFELRDKRYNDIRIKFYADNHTYVDTLGNQYLSTTQFLHNYKNPFDKEYWLKKKSMELRMSKQKLEEQWGRITKEACDRGTKVHNELEDSIKGISKFKEAVRYMFLPNGEMITVADIPDININIKELDIEEFKKATEYKYPEIYNVFDFYIDRGYKIYSEIGAFLIDYLISGTIDILCIRPDGLVVGDWKTNRGGLKFEAGYYRKDKHTRPAQETDEWVKKEEYLLPPVNNLYDCNGSIYNLQLSMYAKMVELILGIPCKGLWLCHIDTDFVLNKYGRPMRFEDGLYRIKDNPQPKISFHKMTYLRDEVNRLLIDRYRQVEAYRVTNKALL